MDEEGIAKGRQLVSARIAPALLGPEALRLDPKSVVGLVALSFGMGRHCHR